MKPTMKEVPVEQAIGLTLAHDLTRIVPGEFKGPVFTKGHVIREEDIPALLDIGKRHIYTLDIPQGFLHENEAAERMAEAIQGSNISKSAPHEGKVALKSTIHGLVKVNKEAVDQINAMESIALATIVTNRVVQPGSQLAGTRVIPLVVEEERVQRVEQIGKAAKANEGVITVKPFRSLQIGVITTGSEIFNGRIEDKFGPAVRRKIEELGSVMVGQKLANDDTNMIADQIRQYLAQKVDLILVTGGMSVDPDDRTPGAIRSVATEVVSYGTPMLPGSMLMLAYHEDTPIMGLPGCVMHDPYTAFDVFLPRICAGERLAREDITSIGYGGLYGC
jgi:molybdenum cofactor synthesis domain-containing protein